MPADKDPGLGDPRVAAPDLFRNGGEPHTSWDEGVNSDSPGGNVRSPRDIRASRQDVVQAHALLRIQADIGTPRAAVGVSQSTRLRAGSKLALSLGGSRSTPSHRQTTLRSQSLTALSSPSPSTL